MQAAGRKRMRAQFQHWFFTVALSKRNFLFVFLSWLLYASSAGHTDTRLKTTGFASISNQWRMETTEFHV